MISTHMNITSTQIFTQQHANLFAANGTHKHIHVATPSVHTINVYIYIYIYMHT